MDKKLLQITSIKSCIWATSSPIEQEYHDHEWGVPVHSERTLFECLILEGAQAGLSWATVLNKRDGYRKAFADFDAEKVSRFDTKKIDKLLSNPGVIRNKLKLQATVINAKAFLEVQRELGSFDHYIWQFVDGTPIQNAWENASQVPINTIISDAMSKDLKNRGFKFVGSTICYAFMQAIGMVNDHCTNCFRHQEIKRLK